MTSECSNLMDQEIWLTLLSANCWVSKTLVLANLRTTGDKGYHYYGILEGDDYPEVKSRIGKLRNQVERSFSFVQNGGSAAGKSGAPFRGNLEMQVDCVCWNFLRAAWDMERRREVINI